MSLVPITGYRRATTPRRSSATRTHQVFPFPAPLKGLNVSQPLPGGDPLSAIVLENLIPRVFGCELRAGYAQWSVVPGTEVRTLMQYIATDPSNNKKFAASDNGNVYDTTLINTAVLQFGTLTGTNDGEYSWTMFTTATGVHYLVAVCAGAGMRIFDGTTWTQVTMGAGPLQISNVDPIKFDYVVIWKERLWFIENGTTNAWYLPVGQVAGAATKFDFGSLLPNGGVLAALTNWTVDGGDGIDDDLVVVSTEGDVLIYQGTDPDNAATFLMSGRWHIGRVPVGRRFLTQYAQDVAILSERGMVFLSELLRGQGFFQNAVVANNINADLAKLVTLYINSRYWEVRFLPHEQLIVINMPRRPGGEYQYAYEVNTKAFCVLRGMPMLTVQSIDGRSFFGDDSGVMWLGFEGNSDGKIGDDPGEDLQGQLLTTFQPMGEGARVKRFLMVRPSFVARSAPAVQAKLNPDWNFTFPGGSPPFTTSGSSVWDTGLWNIAVWSGSANSYQAWAGCEGTGRFAALSMRVRGEAGTTFIGWTALVATGGIL